jgi:hypothetical protein
MESKRTSWIVDKMIEAIGVACKRHHRYLVRNKYKEYKS